MFFIKNIYSFIFLFTISNCTAQNLLPNNIESLPAFNSTNIRNIFQDNQGFFWLNSQESLLKFDGHNVVEFSGQVENNKRKLNGADCYLSGFSTATNEVFVYAAPTNLVCIDAITNSIKYQLPIESIFKKSNLWLRGMHVYENKIILVAYEGIIAVFDYKNKIVDTIISLPKNTFKNITCTKLVNNSLYIGVSKTGILKYNCNKITLEETLLFSSPINNEDLNCMEVNDYAIYFGTSKGMYKFDFDKQLKFIKENYTTAICAENSNILFSNLNGTFVYNNNFNSLEEINGAKEDKTLGFLKLSNAIYINNDGYYFCSGSGLAFAKRKPSAFKAIGIKKSEQKEFIDHAYNLKKADSKTLLVGGQNNFNIVAIDKNEIVKRHFEGASSFAIIKSPNSAFFIGTTKGLKLLKNNEISEVDKDYPFLKPIKKEMFSIFITFDNINFYFTTLISKKLFVINFQSETIKEVPNVSNINSILSSDGFLWVVEEYKLKKINIETLMQEVVYEPVTNQSAILMTLLIKNEDLYLGVYGLGVLKLNKQGKVLQKWDKTNGLSNVGIYEMAFLNDSVIVCSSNKGLSFINLESNKVQAFYKQDGLHGDAFEESSYCEDSNYIYLGGIDGVTEINKKLYSSNKIAPKLFSQEVIIQTPTKTFDTTNLFLTHLTIPNNYTQVKINFIGINYQNPDRVNYWYRIKEKSNQWIDLKTQNFIDFIGFSPGNYTLEVKAANEDGVECEPIILKLRFLPKWYQTWLFKILVALAIMGLFYGLYKFRINQLKKVLQVRRKISSDLHDDIGSTLSTINMFSQVAKMQDNTSPYVTNIQENTKIVLDKLDDIVWATNPKNDKIENLAERIEGFARPLFKAKNVEFKFDCDASLNAIKISENTRQNLFLICKEAINNTAKYANAKNCNIIIVIKSKQIFCTITDDGIGFNTTLPTERNGLINMENRAKQLKGYFEIKSTVNKGTEIQVRLPL